MKRLSLVLVLLINSFFVPHCFSQSNLTSTNPPVATDLVRLALQARAMKYNPSSDQLVVLSSNNTVSFLRPATLAIENQQQLSYGAFDLAVSDDASLLFVSSDTDRSIHIHRLSDFSEKGSVPITNGVPSNLESLPGGTNAFVVAVFNDYNFYDSYVFVDSAPIYSIRTTNWMLRTATNLILFTDNAVYGPERTDLHLNGDGTLSAIRGESVFFRPGGASSSVIENSKAYIFTGFSSVQCNVFDLAHLNTQVMPTLTVNVPGPPRCATRWGDNGFAFLSKGAVATFRSTMISTNPPADLFVTVARLSTTTDHDSIPTLTLINRGPGAATDIRLQFTASTSVDPKFTSVQSATPTIGSLTVSPLKYGFFWRIPRLEAGETAETTFLCTNPGVGVQNYQVIALQAETDPTPDDTLLSAPFYLSLDPEVTEYLKPVFGGVWGGGLVGSVYIPSIDLVITMERSNIVSAQNLKTGLPSDYATLDFAPPWDSPGPYFFANNEDPSTFLIIHPDFLRLCSGADMHTLWHFPRDRSYFYWGGTPQAALVFTSSTSTNVVMSGQPPVYPRTTNQLILFTNGQIQSSNIIQGGNQLIHVGPDTLLSYIASTPSVLQLVQVTSNGFNLKTSWTNLVAGKEIALVDGVLYSADGKTFSFPSMTPGPAFAGIQNPETVRVFPPIDRAVFVMSGAVSIFELSSRTFLGSFASTGFHWNYSFVPRNVDFSPPDTLYFSSTTFPMILRTPLLRGLSLTTRRPSASTLELSFFAQTGKSYLIQSTPTLPTADWFTEMNVTGANLNFTQTFSINASGRFFRVLQQ
jgi:hypothetical protein